MIKRLLLISLFLFCTYSLFADNVKIGDIVGDANNEVIAVSENGELYVFDKDSRVVSGFPFTVANEIIVGSPVVVDFNGDTVKEIAVISKDVSGSASDGNYTLRYVDNTGTEISSSSILSGIDILGEPRLADLNNDNNVEIYYIEDGGLLASDKLFSSEIGTGQVIPGIDIIDDVLSFGVCNDFVTEYVYIKYDDIGNTVKYYDYSGTEQTGIEVENLDSTYFNEMNIYSILGYDADFNNISLLANSYYWGDIYHSDVTVPNLENDSTLPSIVVDALPAAIPTYTDFEIKAQINDTVFNNISGVLFFKRVSDADYQTVEMLYDEDLDRYIGVIPAEFIDEQIFFYVKASDGMGNENQSAEDNFTPVDNIAPQAISLDIVEGPDIEYGNFIINGMLKITENGSVDVVDLHWKVNGQEHSISLISSSVVVKGEIEIAVKSLDLTGNRSIAINNGDQIVFWVEGSDGSQNFDTVGNSSADPLLTINVIDDITKPEPPIDFNAIVTIDNKVLLDWKPNPASGDVVNYYIYSKAGEDINSLNSILDGNEYKIILSQSGWQNIAGPNSDLSFIDDTSTIGDTYSYFITCKDLAGHESDGTSPALIVTVLDEVQEPLEPPFNISQLMDGSVQITWNEPVGSGYLYNVYRKEGSAPTINDYDKKYHNISSLGFVDKDIEEGNAYYYIITAVNKYGIESGPRPDPALSEPDLFILIQPKEDINITAQIRLDENNNVVLEWQNQGVIPVEYEIYRSISDNIDINNLDSILASRANDVFEYTDNTAYEGDSYYYIVGALDNNNFIHTSAILFIDKKSPEIIVDHDTEQLFNNGNISREVDLEFAVQDNELTGVVFEIYLDKERIYYKQNLSEEEFNIAYSFNSKFFLEGFHILKLKAVDESGNETIKEYNVLIQNSAYSVVEENGNINSYASGIMPGSYFKAWVDEGDGLVYKGTWSLDFRF